MKDSSVDRRGFLRQLGIGAAFAPVWNARSYLAIPGANERLLVGAIGCGSMGSSHLRALHGMKDSANVRVAAVYDVYRKRLEAAAQTGATAYSDYRTLLAQKELDYVLIATPEHWHHRMTLDALDAGKRRLFPDRFTWFASLLWRLAPDLYHRLMRRRFAVELES